MILTALLALQAPGAGSVPPLQDRWVEVARGDSGNVWYTDSQRLEVRGERRIVWFRVDHSANRRTPYRRTLRHDEIDCSAMTFRMLGSTMYRPDGTAEDAQPMISFADIVPDTALEQAAQVVCSVYSSSNPRP